MKAPSPSVDSVQVMTSMLAIEVRCEVASVDDTDRFAGLTVEYCATTARESGCVRCDLIRSEGSPCAFSLLEVYEDETAQTEHQGTPHYAAWRREAVAPLLSGGDGIAALKRPVVPAEVTAWRYPRGMTAVPLHAGDARGEAHGPLVLVFSCYVENGSSIEFARECATFSLSALGEPGVARMDVLQSLMDPSAFTLIICFHNVDAQAALWSSPQYVDWCNKVEQFVLNGALGPGEQWRGLFPRQSHHWDSYSGIMVT